MKCKLFLYEELKISKIQLIYKTDFKDKKYLVKLENYKLLMDSLINLGLFSVYLDQLLKKWLNFFQFYSNTFPSVLSSQG